MSCNSDYITNDLIRLSLSVKQLDGSPIDPTTVTAKIKLPDGTIVDLTSSIVRPGVGEYYVDYLPTTLGTYQYEFIGTGAAQVAAQNKFLVDRATF